MTRPIDSSERRREEIYKFIVENPGLGVNELSRKLRDHLEPNNSCAKGTLIKDLKILFDDRRIHKIEEGKQGFKIYPSSHEVMLDATLASTFETNLADVSDLFRQAKKMKNINDMGKISMINFCILEIWGVRFSAMMYDSLSKNRKKQNIQLYQRILKKADELIKEIINYAVCIQQSDQQNKAEFWSLIIQNHDYAIFRSCRNFVSFLPPEFMRKNSKLINKYGVFLPERVLSGKPKK